MIRKKLALFVLVGGDPHNPDGVADHISGVLLALSPLAGMHYHTSNPTKGGSGVNKPLNRFALTLWALALLVLIGEVVVVVQITDIARNIMISQGSAAGYHYGLVAIWAGIRTTLLEAAQLAGIGMLIELVDRIRFDRRAGKSS